MDQQTVLHMLQYRSHTPLSITWSFKRRGVEVAPAQAREFLNKLVKAGLLTREKAQYRRREVASE